jgi:hypothetical protein
MPDVWRVAQVIDSDAGTEMRRLMLAATSTLQVYAHCPRCRVSFTSPDLPVTFDRQE